MATKAVWAAKLMVPKLSVFFMIISFVFIMGIVIGTAIFAKRKMEASVKPLFWAVLIDGAGFLVSSIVFVLCIWMPFFSNVNGKEIPWRLDLCQWIYLIVVQYLLIYLVFRKFMKKYRTPGNAVMFGAGHALAYASVSLVTIFLSLLLTWGGKGEDTLESVGMLTGGMASVGSIQYLGTMLDRGLVMPAQIFGVLLIYIAARKRNPFLLAAAIILNIVNYIPIVMHGHEVWFFAKLPFAIVVSVISLGVLVWITLREYKKFQNQVPDYDVSKLNMDLLK